MLIEVICDKKLVLIVIYIVLFKEVSKIVKNKKNQKKNQKTTKKQNTYILLCLWSWNMLMLEHVDFDINVEG